jgi:hypothetical protein
MSRKLGFSTSRQPRWAIAASLTVAFLWVGWLLISAPPLSAHGGGTPRLTGEVAGPYRVFVWTQPEPLRIGEVHFSIAVVKAEVENAQTAAGLDEPVTNATVRVHLQPVMQKGALFTAVALLQEQLGSYYYEADATLPTEGEWRFTIEVSGNMGSGSTAFVGEVFAARTINWTLLLAAGVLLLFLLGLIGLWNRIQTKEAVS